MSVQACQLRFDSQSIQASDGQEGRARVEKRQRARQKRSEKNFISTSSDFKMGQEEQEEPLMAGNKECVQVAKQRKCWMMMIMMMMMKVAGFQGFSLAEMLRRGPAGMQLKIRGSIRACMGRGGNSVNIVAASPLAPPPPHRTPTLTTPCRRLQSPPASGSDTAPEPPIRSCSAPAGRIPKRKKGKKREVEEESRAENKWIRTAVCCASRAELLLLLPGHISETEECPASAMFLSAEDSYLTRTLNSTDLLWLESAQSCNCDKQLRGHLLMAEESEVPVDPWVLEREQQSKEAYN
ncbi:hypothetical protein CCH79_00016075 [Gambusia affinis]|uniref:Uncharacterized protein n=1 Tax=Gambusia affinis TaxID=33528 RepID=A0A315VD43_GAMAF|nr:hypothetical protein CCH79_00016075 [Gambusia affinis]